MDSYTVAEAARIIGRSPKRVRQLIEAGALPTVANSVPVRIPAEAVHREREKRRDPSPSTPGPKPDPERVTLDLATLLDYARETSRLAIEATNADREAAQAAAHRVEAALTESLAEARARALTAEHRAATAEAELAALRTQLTPVTESVSELAESETSTEKRRWRWGKS